MAERQLKVMLLKYTPEPEETVSMSAKLCYSPIEIETLKEKIEAIDQSKFVEKLMKIGHLSPIEHAVFTFAIEGISRACSHQLVRHRIASYSQQSQRYVSEKSEGDTFDYIVPPSIQEDNEAKKVFEGFMIEAQKTYNFLVNKLNERGLKGEAANQDARFVLPNACETKIIVTMNARELLHFFRQRCCNRAQWEIRLMAEEMLRLAKEVAPTIFKNAGPPCLKHPCPEGEYSCGKIEEVRKRYGF
ncbi:MAG: FAD-dependent thymidylate synthase [Thermodesulfovibrionales bacterium]|nr:FAD-dependent thymidylate synthase [Thermodesulfovibrionales bacterium]